MTLYVFVSVCVPPWAETKAYKLLKQSAMQKRLPSSEEEEEESSFSGERLELDHLKSWRFLFTHLYILREPKTSFELPYKYEFTYGRWISLWWDQSGIKWFYLGLFAPLRNKSWPWRGPGEGQTLLTSRPLPSVRTLLLFNGPQEMGHQTPKWLMYICMAALIIPCSFP